MTEINRIIIVARSGFVEGLFADNPHTLEVQLLDYDDATEDEIERLEAQVEGMVEVDIT